MTDPRLEAAAEWSEKLQGGASPSGRFADWRSADGNEVAWQAVEKARDESVALADHPELVGIRHATLARVMRDRHRRARRWMSGVAAAGLIGLTVPLTLLYGTHNTPPAIPTPRQIAYATERGQRLTVMLPDGSHLTLDTASRVRVAYSNTERRLLLDRGQALFEVAKHQGRPFVVSAGDREIVAHGTKFDVRLDPSTLRVALVEGKVSVAADRARPVAMIPDDLLTATPNSTLISHVPGQASALTSWSEGELTFENDTLATAAAEINRYGTTPIVITDPKAADLKVSGSFRIGETETFLEALQLGFPVRISRIGDRAIRIAMQH